MSTVFPPENAPSDDGICVKIRAYSVLEVTVWEVLTVYVPAPPDPVPRAVIMVFVATVDPWIVWPRYSVPEVTAVTVKVVPAIDPVTIAPV